MVAPWLLPLPRCSPSPLWRDLLSLAATSCLTWAPGDEVNKREKSGPETTLIELEAQEWMKWLRVVPLRVSGHKDFICHFKNIVIKVGTLKSTITEKKSPFQGFSFSPPSCSLGESMFVVCPGFSWQLPWQWAWKEFLALLVWRWPLHRAKRYLLYLMDLPETAVTALCLCLKLLSQHCLAFPGRRQPSSSASCTLCRWVSTENSLVRWVPKDGQHSRREWKVINS